jgi:hypothetical protein
MAGRKKSGEEKYIMIEVICVKAIEHFKTGEWSGAITPKDFTPGEIYIASPIGDKFHIENNKEQTRKIPKELFFNHFQEAM